MNLRYLFAALCLCLLLVSPAAAAGGAGTAANPYVIETAAELQSIQNNLAAYYVLGNDINMQGYSFTPIGSASTPFKGQLDGNGKTINNLILDSTNINTGLFSVITSGAVIKDVTLENCKISSTSTCTGIISGTITAPTNSDSTVLLSNIICVDCSVSAGSNNAGVLIGLVTGYSNVEISDCVISNCIINGVVSVAGFIGTVVDTVSIKITNCDILDSVVSGIVNIGGFVSIFNGKLLEIDTCTAQNSIIYAESRENVGGFIGQASPGASIKNTNCTVANCIIRGSYYVGGIIGYLISGVLTVENSYVYYSTICAGVSNYAGGFCGRSSGSSTFSDCTISDSTIFAVGTLAAAICPAFS